MTDKTLPSDERTVFIACEDLRVEGPGKFSLLGVMGDSLNIDSNAVGNKLSSLTFVFAFTDGGGTFDQSLEVLDPSGQALLARAPDVPVAKDQRGWMVIAHKFVPFTAALGTYKLCATLDAKRYERTFEVASVERSQESKTVQ